MDCANSSNVPAGNATSNSHGKTSLKRYFSAIYVFPRDQASALTESGPLPPSEIVIAPSVSCAAHPPSVSPPRSSTRVQTQPGRTGNPAPRNPGPLPAPFQLTSTRKPQSHFSTLFTSTGPTSTMPQPALKMEVFDAPTSKSQSQCQMMALETEQGPVRVSIDVQAASKVADERRKHNATASHRFRQRRREREQETSKEAQIREINDRNAYYQQERDFLQDIILQNRILLPPRPLSPRQRKHVSLGGPQTPDTETSAQNGGRNTRRRTDAYVPEGLPSHTVGSCSLLSAGAITKDAIKELFHFNIKPFQVITLH